jgi:hypothetical protein
MTMAREETGTFQAGENGPSVTHRETYHNAGRHADQASGGYDQIMAELNQVNVQAIGEAQLVWKQSAERLRQFSETTLPALAAELARVWSDDASVKAQQFLRIGQATVASLGENCASMSSSVGAAHDAAVHYTAEANRPDAGYLHSYQDALGKIPTLPTKVYSWGMDKAGVDITDPRDDAKAETYLKQFMAEYDGAGQLAPRVVQADLGETGSGVIFDFTRGDHDSGGGSGGTAIASGAGPSIPGAGAVSAGSGLVGHTVPGGGASLSGAGEYAGLGGSFAAGSSSGGQGSGTAGLGAMGPVAAGLGLAGLGASRLGSSGSGGGVFGPSGRGAGASAPGMRSAAVPISEQALSNGRGGATTAGTAGAAGRAGVSGAGGMMAPGMMGAGQAGSGEDERERTAWMVEDEDVWGAHTDAPPPIISE